jgi:curved DNA-binding protein CbpA
VKPLSQLDHYELLEIPRSASTEEVDRAYRLALETWEEESLAGYSVVDGSDAAELRERAEAAYRVLSDPSSRRAYDASCAPTEPRPAPPSPPEPTRAEAEPFDDLDEAVGPWDGPRLRRFRLRRGRELEEIAAVTKISPGHLRWIEEERFAELPARVYVRGFVAAYAGCLGLDPTRVAADYIERYERSRGKTRRERP